MKLWIDDLRPAPDGWDWAKTSLEAINMLNTNLYTEASFDHDLGGEDTTRKVILWLCENDTRWPIKCYVHSFNPIGAAWLLGMINRYHV